MIGKLFLLSVLLVGFASAQDIQSFLRQIKAERRNFEGENPCAGRNEAHFASNPRGCAWYFECSAEGVALREDRCEPGRWFSYEHQWCDYSVNIKCDYDDRLIDLDCPAGGGVSVIPHKYSCSKYTVCFDGIENDRECPTGLHFSYYDNDCVDPFYADCDLDSYMCKEAVATGDPLFVPSTRECGSYYLCVGSRAVPLFCREGSHFNIATNYCDLPANLNPPCTPTLPVNNPRIPEKVTIDCEGQTGAAIPHPHSCEFFFFCAGNRSYLQSCGQGLEFDEVSRRCQVAENAECNATDPGAPPVDPSLQQREHRLGNIVRRLNSLLH